MYVNKILQRFYTQNDTEVNPDQIRGCLYGGAVGNALGYSVVFMNEEEIRKQFGEKGITEFQIAREGGKAMVSDDTQMTLFTANGLLAADTKAKIGNIQVWPRSYVAMAYQDWLRTQEMSYEDYCKAMEDPENAIHCVSWLSDVPELYCRRLPGNTCLSALKIRKNANYFAEDYTKDVVNNSKGCGGVMRIAPLGLMYHKMNTLRLDGEAAQIAAITHGNSLGYMPAAMLTHVINRIVFPKEQLTLKQIVVEAMQKMMELFEGDEHLNEFADIIDLAISLSENGESDQDNIRKIGEGWVAEETLAIAIYCALRHQDSFSDGIIAAVNHAGDSDSTGAIAGNILGALLGYDAMEEKWKKDLELSDIIMELADDLCTWIQMSDKSSFDDPKWMKKYYR
jgi:ADP-ribosylglycohydrolase